MTLSEARATDHSILIDPDPAANAAVAAQHDGRRTSRRSVVRAAAMGAVTVLVVGTGALSVRVFDSEVLDPDGGQAYDTWRRWRNAQGPLGLVAAATLAASPHNTQPWTFHVTESSIDLFADPARRIDALDPLGREHFVGLGCALENLVIAAGQRGTPATVTLLPDGPAGGHVAHVELSKGPSTISPLYESIGRRHSNRGPYRPTPVARPVLDGLVDAADLPGVTVQWLTTVEDRATLGQLLVDAAKAVTADERQSSEGFAWFRSSDADIQRYRDGLTLDAQGLSPFMLTMAKLLPPSTRTAGDSFWLQQTKNVHTKTAAAYGVITVADPTDVALQLLGGRLLQRIHLTATAGGIAMQHMNQITERIDREQVTNVAASFAPRFAGLLPAGAKPLATFRVGQAERAARLSPRRAVASVSQ